MRLEGSQGNHYKIEPVSMAFALWCIHKAEHLQSLHIPNHYWGNGSNELQAAVVLQKLMTFTCLSLKCCNLAQKNAH